MGSHRITGFDKDIRSSGATSVCDTTRGDFAQLTLWIRLVSYGTLRNDAKMQSKINDSKEPNKLLHACEDARVRAIALNYRAFP